MTLPMVTCPLCCRPGFSSSESLCSALVDVTTRNLSCPICNCKVTGLDKFTIHLFSHSFNCFGQNTTNDSTQVIDTTVSGFTSKCNNLTVDAEKLQNSYFDKSSDDKQDYYLSNIPSKVTKINPNDQQFIFFRTDNGQIFAVSHEHLSPNLNNVTINTQNYITNTNITTSTIQANLIGNVESRKCHDVFDKGSSCTINAMEVERNNEVFTNRESLLSCPSTPSVSSETDKCRNERVYESCKELLTNGDFTTNGTDLGDQDTIESNMESKSNEENKINNKDCENKTMESFSCEQCSYVFPNKTILAVHNQLIHKKGENDFESRSQSLKCNLCPRTFTLRSSLMIHRRVAHAGGFGNNDNVLSAKDSSSNNSCQVCGKLFSKVIYLSQHMKVHEEKQWLCTICDKGFTTKYFLKKHRRLHTGEMPYRCKTCSKSFTFQQTYRKHLLYHSNDKPYCCAQCGRLFKELSTLHNHERIHSGEKPFACETCGKAFRQRVSYLVHRRIHTGAMPYKCTSCNKSFRYKISQRTHKCTSQPPGIVVRTQGYLVHRLQAAMNKAAEVREAKKIEENAIVCNTKSIAETVSSDIKTVSHDIQNGKECPSVKVPVNLEVSGAYNTQKSSDFFKTISDKSQLYLLIKGSNGETYYQPLIVSQNLMSSSHQNYSVIQSMAVHSDATTKFSFGSLSSSLQCTDFDDKNQDKQSIKSTSVENIIKPLSLPEINKFPDNELNTNKDNQISSLIINNAQTEVPNVCNIATTAEEIPREASDKNTLNSDINSSILSEFFDNLIYTNNTEASCSDVCNEAHSSNSDSSNDTTMESSDLFSLTFSPSLSSPSDKFGQLSLSPNSPVNISPQTCKPKSPSITNLDHSHDSFFENLTDESLKELLFGGMK